MCERRGDKGMGTSSGLTVPLVASGKHLMHKAAPISRSGLWTHILHPSQECFLSEVECEALRGLLDAG